MRIVHLADLHLGFRQFQRVTGAGINQRERDVAHAFTRAVDLVTGLAPDVILVAGDVFHSPRPTNAAIVHAVTQFARLVSVAPVAIVAGNHDSPRSTDGGHILPLLRAVGCNVVLRDPTRVRIGDTAIWCVPDTGVWRPVTYTPDTTARYNVALVHGEVRGVIAGKPEQASDIDPAVWRDGWDYVALGHYHVQQQVAPRAWYAGSLEYTSSNPWEEIARTPKGLLLADLAAGTVTPHAIGGVRRFVDLPRIDGAGLRTDDTLAIVALSLAAVGDLTGAVVRQVVADCDPSVASALRPAIKHAVGRGPLQVHVDVRRLARCSMGTTARLDRRGLAEMLADVLLRRADASGLNADAMTERGLGYLKSAGEAVEFANKPVGL